jgi:hypothetical protein
MTAAQDLAANVLTFMENNIVIVSMDGDTSVRSTVGTTAVQLYSRPGTTGHKRNWKKSRVGVYYMAPATADVSRYGHADPNPITTYFCPYKERETHGTVISNGANLFFTSQMDGCSLGIGQPDAAGCRLIFHANAAGTTFEALNRQDQLLRTEFARDATMIQAIWSPRDYRESRKHTLYMATTFGVRDPANNTWEFYCQRYTVQSLAPHRTLGLKGVFRVL